MLMRATIALWIFYGMREDIIGNNNAAWLPRRKLRCGDAGAALRVSNTLDNRRQRSGDDGRSMIGLCQKGETNSVKAGGVDLLHNNNSQGRHCGRSEP
jgi:hypothetical protein